MKIPFPYDVIGYWTSKHNIDLPSEADLELAELFIEYSKSHDTEGVRAKLLHIRNEIANTPASFQMAMPGGNYIIALSKEQVLDIFDKHIND